VQNPAVRLYLLWREILRVHGEHRVEWYRDQMKPLVDRAIERGTWEDVLDDGTIERTSFDIPTSYSQVDAPLDYRMSLRAVGITDRHAWETPTLGVDLTVFEPVIRLQVRRRHAVLDLYPNGDFTLHNLPSRLYQIFPRWTFLKAAWIAGRRHWAVLPVEATPYIRNQHPAAPGWVNFNEKDWQHPVPYLPNHSFVVGAHYQLVPDALGLWVISTQRNSPVGAYDFHWDGNSAELLRAGYAQTQRRYRRFERASIRNIDQRTRDKIAIYVPKHGRMTGLEAVERFSQNMRVYEPVKAVKEATDGRDSLDTSPIHQ
jgi:hypothetical protein